MSAIDENFPPKPKWTANDMPDLTGKVMIVTGGNSGIGKQTVKTLLKRGAKVYMASRNKAKAMKAIFSLQKATGREAIFLELDLANLRSVKKAAAEFQSKEKKLHVLFNNAGVMVPALHELTADGYDMQFGVNVLGHFYFTRLLLPTMMATVQADKEKTRVVTVSSHRHLFTKLNYDALRAGNERNRMGRQELYQMSKYGCVAFAAELARRYGGHGIVSIAVNPGNIRTGISRHAGPVSQVYTRTMFHSTEKGALTQLYAGTAPEAAKMNGKYLIPWARVSEARADAVEPPTGKKLWEWMKEQMAEI
ncbi:NAD(P)-binding protein [Wolfiporia cocos MD-104 SS10]|uniref:NAD(P)-binding protein n=1 Tax=Wolfiporia cocos (strain MD-104) TaxID=742152 RepID=A0A2H3JEJ5_WOLCO|nr:NAD(P)-binding protein [Wolfiporia cocos MD-104 SS10]